MRLNLETTFSVPVLVGDSLGSGFGSCKGVCFCLTIRGFGKVRFQVNREAPGQVSLVRDRFGLGSVGLRRWGWRDEVERKLGG